MSYIWLSWSNLDGELTSVQQVYVNSTISLFYFVGMVPLLLLVIMLHMTITSSHSLVTHVTLNNTSTIFFFFFFLILGWTNFLFLFLDTQGSPCSHPIKKISINKRCKSIEFIRSFSCNRYYFGKSMIFSNTSMEGSSSNHRSIWFLGNTSVGGILTRPNPLRMG